jgi:hypothetical protein
MYLLHLRLLVVFLRWSCELFRWAGGTCQRCHGCCVSTVVAVLAVAQEEHEDETEEGEDYCYADGNSSNYSGPKFGAAAGEWN